MTTVTWLHLSDLHFKSGKEFESFNQEIVLDALWSDISRQLDGGLKPDFIVFTGDIAYSGRKEEYELAGRHFFDPLLEITNLPKSRLFLVPGNHDVNWAAIDPIIATGMRMLLANRDLINQFLSAEQDRRYAFRKFHAYAEFVNTYFESDLTFSDTECFYNRIVEIHNHKIAIIGLNSVWMSGFIRDTQGNLADQGNLLIGERQLEEAVKGTEQASMRIAILHHPVYWLHETDHFYIETRLETLCDFVLYGHWHIPQVKLYRSLAGQTVYIPAGAVYAHRDFPNGYNFVQVDLDSRRVKVYLRRYNDKGPRGPEWTKDIQSTGEDRDGIFEFGLVQEELSAIFPVSPSACIRVLLLEDEREWQDIIRSILVAPDFDLRLVTSYQEAKTELCTKFDLIIVNLCLVSEADYEGVLLLDDLIDNGTPCVVLTGSAIPMRGLFERYKVCEIFNKGRSFNKAEFRGRIKEIIGSYDRIQLS